MSRSYSRQFVHPVALLSVKYENIENIATMAWVSPVSFDPPLVMVAVSPKRYSHELVEKAGEFALLVLGEDQKELSTLAGTKTGRREQKWELEPFKLLRKAPRIISAPLLKECRAAYECKLVNQLSTGDHTLFIGEIVAAEIHEEVNPLILFNREYRKMGDFIARYP